VVCSCYSFFNLLLYSLSTYRRTFFLETETTEYHNQDGRHCPCMYKLAVQLASGMYCECFRFLPVLIAHPRPRRSFKQCLECPPDVVNTNGFLIKNGLIIVTCERAASKELVRTVLRDRFHGLLFKLVQPSVRDLLEVPSVKFTEERNLLMVLVQLACKP
jgi:hypothetical protein